MQYSANSLLQSNVLSSQLTNIPIEYWVYTENSRIFNRFDSVRLFLASYLCASKKLLLHVNEHETRQDRASRSLNASYPWF